MNLGKNTEINDAPKSTVSVISRNSNLYYLASLTSTNHPVLLLKIWQ